MKFLINTPAKRGSTRGNRITAIRWSRILRGLGHRVAITDQYAPLNPAHRADVLIALHAARSASAIRAFGRQHPDRTILLCLTGTDVHRDLAGHRQQKHREAAIGSLQRADRIILLEPECKKHLALPFQDKTSVIFQSATPLKNPPPPLQRSFEISVLCHLRDEKDPLRTAWAARRLPDSSRIQIHHVGSAYTQQYKSRAEKEQATHPRYRWLGPRTHAAAKRILARSRATVLTSRMEGGPAVFAEAVMNDVPILATRIDASLGLLGRNYPGLFEVGDTEGLTELLVRTETDRRFYLRLKTAVRKLKKRFHPDTERAAWRNLIQSLP